MMADISLTGVLAVAAVAFLMPLVLGLAPSLRLPSVVLEIVAGIVIGPAVLGFVEVDVPLQVLALLGLAFLLFLAGLEIDLDHLRGARLRSAAVGFVVSLAVALGIGLGLYSTGLVGARRLVDSRFRRDHPPLLFLLRGFEQCGFYPPLDRRFRGAGDRHRASLGRGRAIESSEFRPCEAAGF